MGSSAPCGRSRELVLARDSGRLPQEVARVARRKQALEEAEITAWPSSLPDEVGSIAPPESDLSIDAEERGSRFLSDAVEQGMSGRPIWDHEFEEPHFDARMGEELLRSFGLTPPRSRTTTRPRPHPANPLPNLAQPPLPNDLEEFIATSDEIDLTEQTIREASLLDHESEEAGEVESPSVRTDDTHTHGKRRGGHARTSLRPPRGKY